MDAKEAFDLFWEDIEFEDDTPEEHKVLYRAQLERTFNAGAEFQSTKE